MKKTNNKNRWFAILIIVMIILGMVGSLMQSIRPITPQDEPAEPAETEESAAIEEAPSIEAGIDAIAKYGNIVLTVSPDTMRELGFEPGDMISVTAGDTTMQMPIGTAYSDVDSNLPVCTYRQPEGEDPAKVILAINMGDLATALGIAEKHEIEESPGYEWTYINGFDENSSIVITMAEKQGYADEYMIHQVMSNRSNVREDYADLSDEEYANFREIRMGSIGTGTLYRSSSPIDPELNRNREADEAMLKAQIHTVMNMADHKDDLQAYEDYAKTWYSGCDIIALNMGVNFNDPSFAEKLAEGLRFFADHNGPYLIHCREGKDRTGIASALLECLMGASAEEIMEDYMKTYIVFYGVEQDSEAYQKIAQTNIVTTLQNLFAVKDLYDPQLDLSGCAETYLKKIGLNEKEITSLKNNLSKDYGGMDLSE